MSDYSDMPLEMLVAMAKELEELRGDTELVDSAMERGVISQSERDRFVEVRRKVQKSELNRIKEEIRRRAEDNELDDPVDIDIE